MVQKIKIIILMQILAFNFTLLNEVNACCEGNNIITLTNISISEAVANEVLSPNTTNQEGTCIFVSGSLTIDQDYEFTNIEFRLDQGATIIVKPDVLLAINSSNLEGCTYLWNEIKIEEDGILDITNSSISDGNQAINPDINASLYLTGVTFDNNVFSVTILVPQLKDHHIQGCSFIRTAEFLKGIDATSTNSNTSFGIFIAGTSSVNIGYPAMNNSMPIDPVNIFDNLFVGILGDDTNLSVHGCQFKNISDCGIVVSNDGHLIQSGLGVAPPSNSSDIEPLNTTPSFENVHLAIEAVDQTYIKSDNNLMVDCFHGYDMQVKPLNHFTITENNIINSFSSAISVESYTSAGLVKIEDNYISSSDNQNFERSHGIFYRLPERPFVTKTIKNNEIRIFDQDASAILVANHGPSVFNNQIKMGGIGVYTIPTGIDIVGVSSGSTTTIYNNTIRGIYKFIDSNIMGIRSRSASKLNVHCNTMDNLSIGTRFEGVCTDTDFRGNSFHNHRIGLHLYISILGFGAQEHTGNTWTGEYVNYGALYGGDMNNLSEYQFKTNPLSNPTLWPPNHYPSNGWFLIAPGDTYTCPDGSTNEGGGTIGIELVTPTDIAVAEDNLSSMIFNDEQGWLAEKRLFRKIQDQNLLGINAKIDGFYDKNINTNIAELVNIEKAIEFALTPNEIDNEKLDNIRNQITDLMNSISNITKELANLSGAEQAPLIQKRKAYGHKIHELNVEKKILIASLENHRNNLLDQVIPLNDQISPENIQEKNYKDLNDINLNYLFKENTNLSEFQINTIYNIANQCPYKGGEAVYKARLIYNTLIDTHIYFDDDSLCGLREHEFNDGKSTSVTEEPLSKDLSNTTFTANVFPNPANEFVNLIIPQSSFETGEILIFDVLGKKVFDFTLSPSKQKYTFDTSHFDDGVYFYQIWIDGQSIASDKLNIFRN